MTTPNDGGPAFPIPIHKLNFDTAPEDFKETNCTGMTLRDWFAGMALLRNDLRNVMTQQDIARNAYQLADAMLAERNKK